MPVKYQCNDCGRRFVDWGAEKLGYRCPACADAELVFVGAPDESAPPAPKLRARKRPPKPPEESEVTTAAPIDGDTAGGDGVAEVAETGDAHLVVAAGDEAEGDEETAGEEATEALDFEAETSSGGSEASIEDFEGNE